MNNQKDESVSITMINLKLNNDEVKEIKAKCEEKNKCLIRCINAKDYPLLNELIVERLKLLKNLNYALMDQNGLIRDNE